MKKVAIVFCVLLGFIACKENKNTFWKYAEGYHIGDVIAIDYKNNQIKNDTIYFKNKAVAAVISIENRILSNDKVLIIKDINSTKTSRYIEK